MNAISLFQPWAQLIADRKRKAFTKSWPVTIRGKMAIHAAGRINEEKCKEFGYNPSTLRLDAIVAIVEVKDCVPIEEVRVSKFEGTEKVQNSYAVKVNVIKKLRKPIPMKGHPKVWTCQDIW